MGGVKKALSHKLITGRDGRNQGKTCRKEIMETSSQSREQNQGEKIAW